MIKKSHIGNYLKPVMMAGLLFVCSCSDDDEIASNTDRLTTSDVVTFNIQTTNRWTPDVIGDGQDEAEAGSRTATRSRSVALPMESVEGNAPATDIYMYMIEEDYLPEADTMTVASRSSGTEGTPSSDAIDVGVIAFHTVGEETELFMDNINLTSYQEDTYWPGTGKLDFYAYYPYVQAGTETDGLTLSKENNPPTFTYEVPAEISKQRDLMDGASKGVAGDLLSSVDMQLNHVMSQIQVSIPDNGIAEGVISSITFKNIHNKGTRTMGQEATEENDLGWELLPNGEGKTPQTVNYELTSDFNKTMYLMPQQLREDAEIVITMSVTSDNPLYDADKEISDTNQKTRTSEPYTLRVNLNNLHEGNPWKPNKKYTYVVSTPEEVKVEVTDEIVYQGDNPVKQNVEIKNTGLSAAWIRVAIVGAWMVDNKDDEGNIQQLIVAEWKTDGEKPDGKFTWPSDEPKTATPNANHWLKGNDGYYYYMQEVPRGKTLEKLFTSYELTANAPMANAYLELSIMAQAVLPADRDHIWPEEIVGKINGNQ